jgi:hypothetical protein
VKDTWKQVGLAILMIAGTILAALLPYLGQLNQAGLQAGDVVPQDIVAPYLLAYDSAILTEQQRVAAASAVDPIFTSVDTSVARRQLDRLRLALAYITSVREDQYASLEQQLSDLNALEAITLDAQIAEQLLLLSDSRWLAIQDEATQVLEQVMRTTIRDTNLDNTIRNLPTLVSLSLPEEQVNLVVELVAAFVAPNSFYDAIKTEQARQEAMTRIVTVRRTYVAGETIVLRGQLLTAEQYEALEAYDLLVEPGNWQDLTSGLLLSLMILMYFGLYLQRHPELLADTRKPLTIVLLFLSIVLVGRLTIPGHTLLPYLYPAVALSMTLTVLFGPSLALIVALPMAVLIAYDLPRPLELTLYVMMGSFFGVLGLQHARRLIMFFISGGLVGLAGLSVLLIYRLPDPATDLVGMLTLGGGAIANGVASAVVSLVLQFFLAGYLDMISPLQLIELTRPDHPLLQFMLRYAPGTYQHSLQVANLAEQAAERIGADVMLVRVGALYHDAGKALNPGFFVENQPPGEINPHDDLDPLVSSATIIRHVTDGIELARRYRLPRRIQDFILEHHGRMLTYYQYVRAVQEKGGVESEVDASRFRYPGPSPRSPETALLMLADGCEARARAERPRDEGELRTLIQNQVDTRAKVGELKESGLTLGDLEKIVDSFTATLRGVYHPRIDYPKLGETKEEQHGDQAVVERPPEAAVEERQAS